jgi:hypothetical protein
MTTRAKTAGIVLTLVLVVAGITAMSLGGRSRHVPTSPAVMSAAAVTTSTATTTPPSTTTSSTLPPPTTAPPGPWQPVAQVAGLYRLTTATGEVLRIDPHQFEVAVVPGTAEPGGTFPEGGAVPAGRRAMLVMATNAGFKRRDARGGELVDGRTAGSLVAGAASLVMHADGTIDVGAWGVTVGPRPDNVAVLQNLTLLVDHGQPAADLGRDILLRWGLTFRPAVPVAVWRSAAGIDDQGRLLWGAGPNLLPAQLAQLLITAGAVRAMELDINHLWVFASLFVHPDPQRPDLLQGNSLMAAMTPNPNHVLTPGQRDFIAVYRRPG